jgi:hypothetical protein
MASIGNVGCTFVKGFCPAAKMRLEVWTVPGLDGYGAAVMGRNDAPFQVLAILYSNILGIDLWRTQLESLQGHIVTIVNDQGVSFPNCLILKLSPLKSAAAFAESGITQRGEMTVEGVVLG